MGRITGFVGAEDSVSYTYDDNGNVLTVSDKNGVIKREYDALNRIIKLTDTFGKSIQYTYDAVGNLASIIYPDNTAVNYTYDANNNLVSVTDWANRVTSYTYDVNNMVVGVTKPDGSVTTTVYDNAQRIVSTVERTASNVVITGFEYTYDNLSRIIEEKHLADNTKICYTYDNLSRVTNRTIKNECDCVISSENFTYDAAGNITDAPNSCFAYDTNNRLITFNGNTVSYDMDGNMLSNGYINCEFDSGNRLISAGDHTYTYNAEDVRIRNLCSDADTTYTYNTNCRLSQLLQKTTNGIITKYVYGLGLIGEEKYGEFKTYHFDFRGSTVAITDIYGNIIDTFKYDTYGKLISRTGNSFVILGYNGRDGVVTDRNGLLYMRARYYSPEMRRFVNADILHGEISNAVTLNRYAYANGNPVSNVDPFGLSADRGSSPYGSILYNGIYFPIYVPNHTSKGQTISAYWKTIYEITESDFSFDWLKFITGIEFDDVNGTADGTNTAPINNQQKTAAGLAGIFNGLLTSAVNSSSSTFLTFTFQESGDNRRVIIKAGSSQVEQLYNRYANNIPNSAYFSNAGSPLAQAAVSSYAEDLYTEMTGNSTKWYHTYDIQVTVDERHKGSKYSSYLWIDSDGTIMETPILYSNDKVEVGRRSGFLGFGFTSLVDMPINGTNPVSKEYQELFNSAF